MKLARGIALALTMLSLNCCSTNRGGHACPAWGCAPCPYERISNSSWVELLQSKRQPECPAAPPGYVRVNPHAGYVNKCTEEIAEHGYPAPPSMPLRLEVMLDPQRSTDELVKFMEEANKRYPRPSGENMSDQETAEIQKRFALPDSHYSMVEQELTSYGMKVIKVDKYYDAHEVCVDTTVAQAEKAFATQILWSADDKLYSNICDPAVPASPPIIVIEGLNNYPTPGLGPTLCR